MKSRHSQIETQFALNIVQFALGTNHNFNNKIMKIMMNTCFLSKSFITSVALFLTFNFIAKKNL